MSDSTDLELARDAFVADSEQSSDDDVKPAVRKVGLNQQLAFNSCRIPKEMRYEQQPKKMSDKKEDEGGHRLVEDLRGDGGPQRKEDEKGHCLVKDLIWDGGRQKKVRKQLTERESTPRENATVTGIVKRTTSVSMAELDTFRYTGGVGDTHALKERVPVMEIRSKYWDVAVIDLVSQTEMQGPERLGAEHFSRMMENTSDSLEVAAINVDSQIELHFPDQLGAEHLGRSGPAADHAEECVVVDIDTEEVVDLCDETQFSVLLRLCGEECEQDEFRADVLDVDRVPPIVVHGTSLSASEEPPNLLPNRGGCPGRDSMEVLGSAKVSIVSTNLIGNVSDGSVPKQVLAPSAIAPVTNFEDADQPVVGEGYDIEEQKSQDQFCDDFISSMMTQKCVSPPEEVKAPRRIPPSPLQNISNLPARVVKNKQRVNVKFINQAAKRMESKCMKNEDSLDKEESVPLRGSIHEVLELEKSSEDRGQNKENVGGSPPGVIVEEHPSTGGDATEGSNFGERHESVDEDFVMYSPEVRETIKCPVCGENISGISVEERLAHTNSCLDRLDTVQDGGPQEGSYRSVPSSDQVKDWLEKLELSRYASLFVEQEIDWDTTPWLTEEDLMLMGINAIGPRRKIFQAIQELKRGISGGTREPQNLQAIPRPAGENRSEIHIPALAADGISRIQQANGGESNNLITNYFPLPPDSGRNQLHQEPATNTGLRRGVVQNKSSKRPRSSVFQNNFGIPSWMCIPGTPFRVDAFQHLSGNCCHWFLTHFHTDHYQGLTRGFRYGHIFCSSITARLVNLRIGVSWEKLMIIPLHEKVKIAGVDVTFIDANHCPGSVMILFEPPNGEAVLHTGDFRFCPEMANNSLLQTANIHTLVLDTTYCDPQYDFPTQDTVIRFVIEAIQAEMFNSDTLFLIGTYTIGKERIFLEVGKVLKKFVYVGAPKKKLLDCMDLSADDTKWITCNENQSFIHVVPLWSISSFKRMNSIARHYQGRYKLIVAFSPTGWSFGRGKKKTPGKRWKRGTMIRYEVPYSEHCSFSELREFLRFIGPEDIIPSVPGKDGVGADAMIASLWSEVETGGQNQP